MLSNIPGFYPPDDSSTLPHSSDNQKRHQTRSNVLEDKTPCIRGSGHSSGRKLVAPFSVVLIKTYRNTKCECTGSEATSPGPTAMAHWSQNACLGPVNERGTPPPCQLPASASLTPLQVEAGIPGVGAGGWGWGGSARRASALCSHGPARRPAGPPITNNIVSFKY